MTNSQRPIRIKIKLDYDQPYDKYTKAVVFKMGNPRGPCYEQHYVLSDYSCKIPPLAILFCAIIQYKLDIYTIFNLFYWHHIPDYR